jgi:hypothetical protein
LRSGVGVSGHAVGMVVDTGDRHAEEEIDAGVDGGATEEGLQLRLVVGDRRVVSEREVDAVRDLDADDALALRCHELGAAQCGGDGAKAVDESGALEHALDLVVHHDRSWQVVHLGLAFEYPHSEPLAGEQDGGHHADRAAADDHDIGIARHAGPPRNKMTSATACASMNHALRVSWPSRRASGALTYASEAAPTSE